MRADVLKWDASAASGGFTHWATMPAHTVPALPVYTEVRSFPVASGSDVACFSPLWSCQNWLMVWDAE